MNLEVGIDYDCQGTGRATADGVGSKKGKLRGGD